jgi:hypothetical protein
VGQIISKTTAKLFAPVALPCLLLSGTLAAQSPASIQPLAERQQKVLDALRDAKVQIPAGASMPTFLSLLPAMKEWAAIQDDPKPEEMTKLHDLIGAAFPSHLERLARFNRSKVEAQEQPRTVLAYPSATSSMTPPILNPDHVLFKYTVTGKASDIFPPPRTLLTKSRRSRTPAARLSIKATRCCAKRLQTTLRRRFWMKSHRA